MLANADLLNLSVSIFFYKTYLETLLRNDWKYIR